MEIVDFRTIEWANRNMRGKEFGVRGKTYVYFQGRGPFVIRCRTGSKPEQMIRFLTGSSIPGMGPQVVPVFSEDPRGQAESMDFNNLFLSESGEDEWPPKDFVTGEPMPRGEECSLKPNRDYYFYVPAIVGGHPSWNPQQKISYHSTSSDDLEDFESRGIPMVIGNVPGMWYPDE